MPETNVPFPSLPTRRCFECRDLGVTLRRGRLLECWRIKAGAVHNQPNDAAVIIRRAVTKLVEAGTFVDPQCFAFAASLAEYTTANPALRQTLIDRHFAYTFSAVRKLAETVETLRKVWKLPVGSRKSTPTGYWIITDAEDFAEWTRHARSAAITQLSTIHAVAKRNFPDFAGQLYLDFADEIDAEQNAIEEAA